MTQSKQVIVTDNASGQVIILSIDYNPKKDMEESVLKAYQRFNKKNDDGIYLKDTQCSWMELANDWDTSEIIFW